MTKNSFTGKRGSPMSATKTHSIRCPECGTAQNVELHDAINVAQNPELKTALFENTLNRVQCHRCDASFRIDKPLLYHDTERDFIIYWMPDTTFTREEIVDHFDKMTDDLRAALPENTPLPCVRLVFTRPELIELIYLLEAGMNERIVEYIKYSIHTQNMHRVPPAAKQLLLNIQDSTADELLFAVQNVQTAALEDILRYPRSGYHNIRNMYRNNPEEFIELFPGPYISARDTLLAETFEEPADDDDSGEFE